MTISELTDKYGETNTNPYVDTTANNENENLNTKTVERGQKLYSKYGWIQLNLTQQQRQYPNSGNHR